MPDYTNELRVRGMGYGRVAGVDEAGRGPLAGPVVAAAVVLPEGFVPLGLDDSKKMTGRNRERVYEELLENEEVAWGLCFAEAREIDQVNILRATEAAMARAAAAVGGVDYCLIDGRPVKGFPLASEGLVKGDGKSLSIAAASVLAKVARDRRMQEEAMKYPEYGFAKHKGYGTQEHLAALLKYGPCPIHRRSFAPVAEAARRFGWA